MIFPHVKPSGYSTFPVLAVPNLVLFPTLVVVAALDLFDGLVEILTGIGGIEPEEQRKKLNDLAKKIRCDEI